MQKQLKWDLRFLKIAQETSEWSKDPSTKVGAVITNKL
jgi:deoxycytidylate deaminase